LGPIPNPQSPIPKYFFNNVFKLIKHLKSLKKIKLKCSII